jgi:DNA (cytosine-5)-methyltransferase 1
MTMKCIATSSNRIFSRARRAAPQPANPATEPRQTRRAQGNYRPSRSRRDAQRQDHRNLSLALGNELIIDNFAGGGGTSEGLEQAFGRPVDIAINHDPEALAMHALNHPYTMHMCESVWEVDPIKVTNNQPVGLVWLSPDCKHFSKAKGGTPVEKHIRGLAWVALRWTAKCKPRIVIIENVEEFRTWGPLIQRADGKWYPDPKKKGKTFESFVRQLRAQGYAVEWKELRASDLDTPTIRKRFFLIARRDGLPIVWPDATTGDPNSIAVKNGEMRPWRTAAECIDFEIESTSIFDRERPLVANTLRRVAKGTWRYVLNNATPFIVGAPTSARNDAHEVQAMSAFLAGQGGPEYAGRPVPATQPIGTLTTENHRAVVTPRLAPFVTEHANGSNQRNMAVNEPLRTQCAQVKGGHFSVVAPVIAPLRGTEESHLQGDSPLAPISTISAGGTHHALTGAHLVTIGYGERSGQEARAQDPQAPLGTVVTANKHAVVAAHLTHVTHHGDRPGSSPSAPLPTITGANRGEQVVVATCLEQANGGFYDGDGRPMTEPASTILGTGSQQRLISAHLIKYYGEGGQWSAANDPVHTLTTKHRVGLVETVQVPLNSIPAHLLAKAKKCARFFHKYLPEHFPHKAELIIIGGWVLVDITLRMLVPRELYTAQGFPASYQINEIPDPKHLFVNGRQVEGDPRLLPRIPLSKTAQVRMCGNSVCPPVARALIEANFAHEEHIGYRQAA